ncbi:hypothetical protein Hanom_Chr14g01303551 [Helianthus anomalus]
MFFPLFPLQSSLTLRLHSHTLPKPPNPSSPLHTTVRNPNLNRQNGLHPSECTKNQQFQFPYTTSVIAFCSDSSLGF